MGILDHIRKTMHPDAPVNEEGKSPIPQRTSVPFKIEAEPLALAYQKMNEEIKTKDSPKPSAPPKAPKAPTGPKSEGPKSASGAAAAKQEPVKLGGKTPVDTSPTLDPPKASDTKPETDKKKKKEEVKTEGVIRSIVRKIGSDISKDALGFDVTSHREHKPLFKSLFKKKTAKAEPVRARKETDTAPKHTHVASAGKKKSSNLEKFFAHEKAKKEHQPEGKPAPEAKAHASKVMSKPQGKYGSAHSTPKYSGKTLRPTARPQTSAKLADLKKKDDKPASFKVKVRIKALKDKKKSEPGVPIKMDRKDFAKKLKDAGGNLKKVRAEEIVVEGVRSIISRLKNGNNSGTKKTHYSSEQMEKWQKYHKMAKQQQQGGDKN